MKRYTLFALAGFTAALPQLPLNTPPKAGDPICLGEDIPSKQNHPLLLY